MTTKIYQHTRQKMVKAKFFTRIELVFTLEISMAVPAFIRLRETDGNSRPF